jgi:hypothetical protein
MPPEPEPFTSVFGSVMVALHPVAATASVRAPNLRNRSVIEEAFLLANGEDLHPFPVRDTLITKTDQRDLEDCDIIAPRRTSSQSNPAEISPSGVICARPNLQTRCYIPQMKYSNHGGLFRLTSTCWQSAA